MDSCTFYTSLYNANDMSKYTDPAAMFHVLPPEILGEVFCRLPSEQTLSNVAMVCREWSEIASEETTRETVRKRFSEDHKKACPVCCFSKWAPLRSHVYDPYPANDMAVSLACLLCSEYFEDLDVDNIYAFGSTVVEVLTRAISARSKNIIRFIVKKLGHDAFRTLRFRKGQTVLHLAVETGDTDMFRFLVNVMGLRELCSEVNSRKETILHLIASTDPGVQSLGTLRYIIEELGLVDLCDKVDENGRTMVFKAVEQGHWELIRYLVEEKDLTHLCSSKGAVHRAVELCEVGMVRLLAKHLQPADLHHKEREKTVLHVAVEEGHLSLVKYFVEEKGLGNLLDDAMLSGAVERVHLDMLRYMVDERGMTGLTEVCCPRNGKVSPLHHWSWSFYTKRVMEALKYLVGEKGLTQILYEVDKDGNTLLHLLVSDYFYSMDIVRYLVGKRGFTDLCYVANKKGETILHLGIIQGLDMVQFIVGEQGMVDLCYKKDVEGCTPVYRAVMSSKFKVVRYLVTEVNCTGLCMGRCLLHFAISEILVREVRFLAKHLQAIDLRCRENGETVLYAAIRNDLPDVVRLLVEERGLGDLLAEPDDAGESVLSLAVARNHLQLVRYIVDERGEAGLPAACCTKDKAGRPPLHRLLDGSAYVRPNPSQEDVLKYVLVEKGLVQALFETDIRGNSIVPIALDSYVTLRSFESLVKREALVNLCLITNNMGESVLHLVYGQRFRSMLQFVVRDLGLAELCYVVDHRGRTPVHNVVARNDLASIRYLVKERALTGVCKIKGLLHFAIRKGHCDIAKILIKRMQSADLRYKENGETVLHAAVRRNLPDLVRYLLEERGLGNLLCEPNDAGEVVMSIAVAQGHLILLRYLVSQCGREAALAEACSTKDKDGRPPLHRLLLNASNIPFSSFFAVLRYIVEKGHTQVCYVVDESSGNTIIHSAVEVFSSSKAMITKLLRYVVGDMGLTDVCRITNLKGETIMHKGLGSNIEAIRFLDGEVDLSELCCIKDHKGRTLLHDAVNDSSLDVLRYFVEEKRLGDILAEPNDEGETVMSIAIAHGCSDTLKYVLSTKGNKELPAACCWKNKNGVPALYTLALMCAVQGHNLQSEKRYGEVINVLRDLLGEVFLTNLLLEATDNEGNTVLHTALLDEFCITEEELRYLVRDLKLIDLCSIVNKKGETILHVAMSSGNVDAVRFIVHDLGLFELCFKEDYNGHTPIQKAVETNEWSVLQYLVEEQGMIGLLKNKDVFEIVFRQHDDLVIASIKKHLERSDLRRLIEDGVTMLHDLVRSHNFNLLKYFIEEMGLADYLSEPDDAGDSVLSVAVAEGNLEVLRYLMDERGKTLSTENCTKGKDGRPPLHRLLQEPSYDIMKVFSYLEGKRGLSNMLNEVDKEGNTVLHAMFNDSLDNMKLVRYLVGTMELIDLCSVVNAKGETVLHRAVQCEWTDTIFEALWYFVGAKGLRGLCDRKDINGNTILHVAAAHHVGGSRALEGFSFLTNTLKLQNLCFETNDQGETLLHIAAKAGLSLDWHLRVGSSLKLPDDMYARLRACVDASGRTAMDLANERERAGEYSSNGAGWRPACGPTSVDAGNADGMGSRKHTYNDTEVSDIDNEMDYYESDYYHEYSVSKGSDEYDSFYEDDDY
eukprot:Rmarinus@m.6810